MNRLSRATAAIGAFACLSPPLASGQGITTVYTLHGACNAMVAMGVKTGRDQCSNELLGMTLPNGREGFIFTAGGTNGAGVSFFGSISRELHPDGNATIEIIDRVRFVFAGSTDDLVADGVCQTSEINQRRPVTITCEAKTTEGRFAGSFTSDGNAPDTDQVQ